MMIQEWSILILFLNLQVLAFEQRIYCVKTNPLGKPRLSNNCQKYITWSTMTAHYSKYFTSYTKIRFPIGSFNLDKGLFINNVTNISLIGSDYNKPTSIKCFNKGFFSISNAAFVEIRNFKLETCGANTKQHIKVSDTYTALLLHNARSVNIFGLTFKNSYGHSIIGINVMEFSVFRQVSIFYEEDNSDISKRKMGGVILSFSDETTGFINYRGQQNILLEQYHIFYLNNLSANKSVLGKLELLHSLALEIGFHQKKYSVKIAITNASIKNIKAQFHPLIYITYNATNTSEVSIKNSNLCNNSIYGKPIIEIYNDMRGFGSRKSVNNFEILRCNFSYNVAQRIFFISCNYFLLHKMIMNLTIASTVFAYNEANDTFWKVVFEISPVPFLTPMVNIFIKQCTFDSNNGFNLEFHYSGNITLLDRNLFTNNVINEKQPKALLNCSKAQLIFKGYNEFSFNTAYWILDLSNYTILIGNAIINITYNTAILYSEVRPKISEYTTSALMQFTEDSSNHLCMFQFYLSLQNSPHNTLLYNNLTQFFKIAFEDNENYSSLISGTQLNSCFWLNNTVNFGSLTVGDVMASVMNFNSSSEQVVHRQVGTLCYCDDQGDDSHTDCIKDHFNSTFPGQTIPIKLKQMPPYSKTSIYVIAEPLDDMDDIEQCPVQQYQLNWMQVIDDKCSPISYAVTVNATSYPKSDPVVQCYVSFKTTYPDDSLYIYHVDINTTCPKGFEMINGSCECDTRLKQAFPTITCDVNTQTITRPGGSWIGLSAQGEILYVKDCATTYCKKESTNIHLNSSDTQCNHNRGGIACGQCPSGLGAVFGSLSCKRCSNQWLLLIPAFLLAGLFIILFLFTLNLTIVDGIINGFILYVNVIVANVHAIFLPSSSTGKVMSLLNLDSAIEVCFYNDMTEYVKTWLQFVFPLYLLFIVAMLALASRYFSVVERLTRRRVIPVIATIFLFSYSKLLLITTKVLFSYTTVHNLSDNKKTTVWMWDTSIPLFGVKFSILFAASLLLILIVLLPLNFFLLFTRFSLRIRILAKYLKPYLDVFQAPFKDSCRHFPGLELLIRWISFAIGSRFLKSSHQRLALNNSLCVFLLLYICAFKPFKSLANTVLYISYAINVECIINLLMYSDVNIEETYYIVILHALIFIALAEFGATVLYYFYIHHLQKIKKLKKFISNNWLKCSRKFKIGNIPSPSIEQVGDYEQLQEELLLVDLSS